MNSKSHQKTTSKIEPNNVGIMAFGFLDKFALKFDFLNSLSNVGRTCQF
jgi:hypothetical protein